MKAELVAGRRTRALRRAVLRPELGPADPLPGDEIPAAEHVAVFAAGDVVSTCIFFPAECPWRPQDTSAWQLRQMATAPEFRGRGFAAAVLTHVVDLIATRGGGTLWCYAREPAVGFYLRAGLTPEGEPFSQHGQPHLRMWRHVAAQEDVS